MALFLVGPQREQLEVELRDLEQRAATVRMPGADAPFYNAAGDLCLDARKPERALDYYGLAVDAYLKAERWEAGAAICRKILRISPESVRARCTLSWLAIGKGFAAEAAERVTDYAEAAQRAGREPLAANQLRRMGELAESHAVRMTVAEQLLQIGADRASDTLFGAIFRERNHPLRSLPRPQNWEDIRHAALLGPAELHIGDALTFGGDY